MTRDPREAGSDVPNLIPGGQLFDTAYEPVQYAVAPIAPLGEFLQWVGRHGAFKSTAAEAACLCVATGRPYGGLPVRQGKAVFITAEDSERTIAFRVRAWVESVPLAERAAATKAIRDNFYFLAREHLRGLALTFVEYGQPSARAAVIARLTEVVRDAILVFVETAARLSEADENSNRAQAVLGQAIAQIAMDSGAAVGLVCHVSKQAGRDHTTDSYAGRGGGALPDAARSVVTLTRPDGGAKGEDPDPLAPVVMTHSKATLSRPAAPIVWQPVETSSGGVYLRALSSDEEFQERARKLLAAIPPEGITMSEVHKQRPGGLTRNGAKAAMEFLVQAGSVVATSESRGRNKAVTVYRVVAGGAL